MKIKWRQQLQCRELWMTRWSDGRVPILIILKFAVDVRAVAAVQHESTDHQWQQCLMITYFVSAVAFCQCLRRFFYYPSWSWLMTVRSRYAPTEISRLSLFFESNCSCRSSSSMLYIQRNADTVHAYISFSVILPRLISVVRNGCRFSGIAESVMLLVLLQKKKMGQHRLIPQPVYLYR